MEGKACVYVHGDVAVEGEDWLEVAIQVRLFSPVGEDEPILVQRLAIAPEKALGLNLPDFKLRLISGKLLYGRNIQRDLLMWYRKCYWSAENGARKERQTPIESGETNSPNSRGRKDVRKGRRPSARDDS